ncbi:MAG: hypothetical protein ACYYKD_04930 [Rhodospirillales bacterium]
MRPRARFSAARFAAVTGLVCGLAAAGVASAGVARAADDAPTSRTPLADTGLWAPPVLQPNSEPLYKHGQIPADKGLAAFYGTYQPGNAHDIALIDRAVFAARAIRFFGNDKQSVHDVTLQYKVLHQGENYVLVKFRQFPLNETAAGEGPKKQVGFGLFVFQKHGFKIKGCKPALLPMFEPDSFDQTPERDIADLIESGVDEIMRREFAAGEALCGGGGGFGVYGRRRG